MAAPSKTSIVKDIEFYKLDFPLLEPPFKKQYWKTKLYPHLVKRAAENKLDSVIKRALYRTETFRVRYFLIILGIGEIFQEEFETLKERRSFDYSRLTECYYLPSHYLISEDKKEAAGLTSRAKKHCPLSDEDYLAWYSILEDLLFTLSEHVHQINTANLVLKTPTYCLPKSPNQEPQP